MVCTATLTGTAESQANVLASAEHAELSKGQVHVPLNALRPITETLQSLAPDQKVYLILRDLRADAQPGAVFNLYLDRSPGTLPPSPDRSRYVGTLNFYAAAPPASGGHQVSFEVTSQLAALRVRGEILATIGVTVATESTPAPGSRPTIGSIELVVQ